MSLASNEQRSYGAVGGGGWEFEDGAENGGQNIDQLSQSISKKIFQINNQASSLEKTIKKLGTPDDNRQFREKQQAMQQDINQTAEEIPKLLHRLYGGAVERSQKLQAERLKTSFKQALERYDGIQRVMASGIDRLGLRPVPVRSLNDDTEPIKALLQSVFKCKPQAERNRLLALKDQAARQRGSVFKSVEAALKHYYRLIDENLDLSDLEICPADLVVIPTQQEVVTTVSQPRRSSWASESDISPETRDLA